MRVFVISDTHFGHDFLEKNGIRPKDFSAIIVSNWNRLVKPEDMIIHLGDLTFDYTQEVKDLFQGLNGKKILVMGNHDKRSMNWYLDAGFDFVCHSFSWHYFGKEILFTHEPEEHFKYDINIHGHLHEGRHREKYVLTKAHLLFSLEKEKYTPVLLKTFLERNRIA